MATTEATQPNQKPQMTSSYACHICGLNGHKMIDCPKFVEMQKIFHGKYVAITEVQPVVDTQIIISNVNVVDINVTTRIKVIEKHVFKDREPRKANSAFNWEKEKRLKKSLVEIIQ
jgi:hypothetical protein